jgi:hypothetical protein
VTTPLPSGWIAARPTAELTQTASSIASLSDPVGTRYPFMLGDKKYLAMVVASAASPTGRAIAILQPENQL